MRPVSVFRLYWMHLLKLFWRKFLQIVDLLTWEKCWKLMNDQHNHLGCFPKPTTSFTSTKTKLLVLSVCTCNFCLWNYSWLFHFSVQLKGYLECSRHRTHQEWFLWIDLQKGLQVHLVALKRPRALLHVACAAFVMQWKSMF